MKFLLFFLVFVYFLGEEPGNKRRSQSKKGLEYFQQFDGTYYLDRSSTYITQVDGKDYLHVSLSSLSNQLCVEYYESIKCVGILRRVQKVKIVVEMVFEPPITNAFIHVKIEGFGHDGQMIYERTDIFDENGMSIFPLFPPDQDESKEEDQKKPVDVGKKAVV